MRKIFILLIAVVVSLSFAAVGFAAGTTYNGYPVVNVLVNGNPVKSDVPAIVMDGTTLLPVRAVADALGYEVAFEQDTNTVKIGSRKQLYHDAPQDYYFKSSVLQINESTTHPFVIMDGEAYVGLAVFGKYANWDGQQVTISIPNHGTAIVPRGQEYRPGIDGHMSYGRTMIKLPALGLKALIVEEPSMVNSTYKPGTIIIEAIDVNQ